MNHYLGVFAIQAFALTAVSFVSVAQEIPTYNQEKTVEKICAFDAVEKLLPAPVNRQTQSPFSYLEQQGFVQDSDTSWVCYVNDPKKEGRYYTIFKVQQIDNKLVASTFLENGNLIAGQKNRSLDFFITLIENHTNTTPGNRQSIRIYLDSFFSLVQQGKVPLSRRSYLFDQPNRGFVSYHPLLSGKLQGSAVTININMTPKN
ncbi:MAG: hypothetical protein SAL70_14960 [Scytonema sp. PMC 1070.18]|nr:hypothetical protein [Scytonema sp. PMC 1070.18]